MKTPFILLTLSAIVVAFLAGYWPQRQDRLAAEGSLEMATASLERAEARNRLYALQSKLVDLVASVEARNFGDAQGKATLFFDAVRTEATQPDQIQAKGVLEGILAGRDPLTSALTQNDPAARELLHGAMARLRQALGEPPLPVPAQAGLPTALPSPA